MRRLLLLLTLASSSLTLAIAPMRAAAETARPALTLEKVADDLYVVIGNGGNVAVLVTNEGVVLIDDKFEQDYDGIVGLVKSVTNQPVKYVFNTHHHQDHSGGNVHFITVAEIISHKNARTNIVENKQAGVTNMKPARITFTDETSVFLGGKEVRARYFGRGHTDGDIVIYFPAQRVVHTGDLMAGVTPLIDYSGGGSIVEWSKTVEGAMRAFEFDTVIPGHGAVTNRAGLQTYHDNVLKMRTQISEMIRQGKNKDDVRAMLATLYPSAYGSQASLFTQWSLPGYMTELK